MAKDYDSSFTVEETQAQPGKWLQQSLWQIMTELRTNWNCSHSPPSSVFAALYLTHARLLQCPVQGYAWDKRGGEEPEEEQGENEKEGERKVEHGNTE